ncbi:hypothetical protein [Caballeronia sp. dw_19]|uniref:hypothetical protein n=1 Tax=Caballeronia sp. dw_19 TaxID=2719791 RepID=UPI001BD53E18|nr:hypothetical protein [Caballeronia sp. dw_19]
MTYIDDAAMYERISTQASSLKHWQVDRKNSQASLHYFEWSEFLVKGFWPYIVELSRLSEDETVYFYDIEQGESTEFEKKFGVFPLIQLDISMTAREYIEALHEAPSKDAGPVFALSTTNAYLLFPASMKWHVHGEYSIELAELATTVGLPQSPEFPHDFWEPSEAMRRFSLLK